MPVQLTITLSDEHDAFARRLIEEGRYPNLSAVVEHALELLREQIEAEETETAEPKPADATVGDGVEAIRAKRHEHGPA